jgi:hypothetical protein
LRFLIALWNAVKKAGHVTLALFISANAEFFWWNE